ncbi:Zinc finger, CCHC domain-containing protein [Actinomortierella wolfii]|nr:Zinc finger, CCHC domain-containing protein [Actinomortierella wolfii]
MPADPQCIVDDPSEFAGLVCDTILYEWARTCEYYNNIDPNTGMVRIEHGQFAKWFRIAIETCAKFRRMFPGHRFDNMLRATGLQDASKVKSHFSEDNVGLYEFFPQSDEPTLLALDNKFFIPRMDISSDDNEDERDFLRMYSVVALESYQQMTALIISTLLKKWKADTLEREPAIVYLGHKVLFRLMPSYNKILREAYHSRGAIIPPTPNDAFAKVLEDKSVTSHTIVSNGTDVLEIQNTPKMYDIFGVNADLKRLSASNVNWQTLTQLATQYYNSVKSSNRAEERRSDLIRRIQNILNKAFPEDALRVEAFGSAAIGLGSENSDLDLCITTPRFNKRAAYNDMRFLRNIFAQNRMRKPMAIANARVPIVKFEDPVTRIKVDINCNHVLGVHNSQLIKTYMQIDPRLPKMLYILKALIKIHGIHDSSQGLLSSYTVVMMAIGFFQSQNILPNLQNQARSNMTDLLVQLDHDGTGGRELVDCTFDRDWRRYEGYGASNTKSLGQLLFEFFELFARDFNYPEWEVNIRLGGLCGRGGVPLSSTGGQENSSVSKKNNRPRRRAEFVVMDPFLRQRNVAGTCRTKNLPHVWAVFDYVYEKLSQGDWKGATTPMVWPPKVSHVKVTTFDANTKTTATSNTAMVTISDATVTVTGDITAATIGDVIMPTSLSNNTVVINSTSAPAPSAPETTEKRKRNRQRKNKENVQPQNPHESRRKEKAKQHGTPHKPTISHNEALKNGSGSQKQKLQSTTTANISHSPCYIGTLDIAPGPQKQKHQPTTAKTSSSSSVPVPLSTPTSASSHHHPPPQAARQSMLPRSQSPLGAITFESNSKATRAKRESSVASKQPAAHHPRQMGRRSIPLTSEAALVTASLGEHS